MYVPSTAMYLGATGASDEALVNSRAIEPSAPDRVRLIVIPVDVVTVDRDAVHAIIRVVYAARAGDEISFNARALDVRTSNGVSVIISQVEIRLVDRDARRERKAIDKHEVRIRGRPVEIRASDHALGTVKVTVPVDIRPVDRRTLARFGVHPQRNSAPKSLAEWDSGLASAERARRTSRGRSDRHLEDHAAIAPEPGDAVVLAVARALYVEQTHAARAIDGVRTPVPGAAVQREALVAAHQERAHALEIGGLREVDLGRRYHHERVGVDGHQHLRVRVVAVEQVAQRAARAVGDLVARVRDVVEVRVGPQVLEVGAVAGRALVVGQVAERREGARG